MTRRRGILALGLAAVLALPAAASGHETRPAYLEITETAASRYEVLWRTPLRAGRELPVVLRWPDGVRAVDVPTRRALPDSLVERSVVEVDGGLGGKRIELAGLEASITDVLVRMQRAGGSPSTVLVHPSRPWIDVPVSPEPLGTAATYLRHGVEHILLGYDHLLFVLALMLIVRGTRVLLAAITAFTLAHSVTLALATLGVVNVPTPPVEATIALSVVLLAGEIITLRRGDVGPTARWPWVIAFAFGLLHGFGFAGALTELGLPRDDVPLALLAFNVGVELGQLAFIASVLTVATVAQRSASAAPVERWVRQTAPYAIGVLAAFWFFERLTRF
jgi:hydrogenase/urease accessory protein HupE